jgi:hypothetical protein
MIKRLVTHNIKHISYCTTNLILIAMFVAWPVYASANFKNQPDSLICNFATVTQNGEKVWSTFQKQYVKAAKKRGLSCDVKPSALPTVRVAVASDLPDCSNSSFRHNCFGTETTVKYDDKYVGEWMNGKKHGQGTYTEKWGDTYVGQWKNGKEHGQGTYTDAGNDDIYVGQWKNGKKHGQGTYTYGDAKTFKGVLRVSFTGGDIYEGQWKDGKKHGQGTYTPGEEYSKKWPMYVGQWKNGKQHGQGTLKWSNGKIEKGVWYAGIQQEVKTIIKTSKVLPCSLNNISACDSEDICNRATHLTIPKWRTKSDALYQYVVEATKRGLSCRVGWPSRSSCTVTYYEVCSNEELCSRATYEADGERFWDMRSQSWWKINYITEAKKRGLSCGVSSTSSTTKTSSACSWHNLNVCSDDLVCQRGTLLKNEKRIWGERSPWIKYSVEAKKRGLSCGVGSSSSTTTIEIKAPKVAPVAPKKEPETPAEPAYSLIDPLHIKKYGKTLHTLLLPNTLLFIGEIEDGDERGFRTALRAHEVDTVVLLSGGGLVNEGLRIANIINDKRLTTYVPLGTTCASACSFMFFAGNPKVAHGRLGVHQFYVDDDKKKAAIGKVQKGTQLLVADIIQNLTDFGTPASVFPKMFSTSGMYYFSETEKSAFSDRNKISPETITRINEVLSYFIKDIDNELDDIVLDGMPQKTQSTLIQLELIRIGCMQGPVDGIRGEATKSAIELLSSKMKSKLSSNKFSDLFKRLNNTKVGACY